MSLKKFTTDMLNIDVNLIKTITDVIFLDTYFATKLVSFI